MHNTSPLIIAITAIYFTYSWGPGKGSGPCQGAKRVVGKEVQDAPVARHALLSPAPRRKSLRPPSATALLEPTTCFELGYKLLVIGYHRDEYG